MTRFSGVWPALFTPLTEHDELNVGVTRRLVDHLIEAEIGGLYVGGGTGEGVLLSLAVRMQLAEVVMEQVNGRVPVIVHVGALATADAVSLAKHAAQIGADGAAAIPPFYYSVGFRAIAEHYQLIASASSLPFFLYYIPSTTGVTLSAEQMWTLCQIPNVHGFKYSAFDLYLLEQILSLGGGALNVFCGPDQLFAPMLTVGVDAAIGTTYNLIPHHFVQIYRAFQSGDIASARALQSQANRLIDLFARHGGLPAAKEMMRMLGYDCGAYRRPFRPLDKDESAALRADLDRIGFWEMAHYKAG
ncbi:MAG: dihydrodipicolinate synthase family protein [Anaerolineae bacterium]|nr:dihydrodipicolinate synthase family protein [Anaerolineae bacterium]